MGCLIRVKSGKARPEHLLSALSPKADIDWHPIDVRFVPDFRHYALGSMELAVLHSSIPALRLSPT